MLAEVIEALAPKPGKVIVDGTLGSGGHSVEIAKALGDTGRLITIDADAEAIERGQAKLADLPAQARAKCQIDFIQDNFRNLDQILEKLGVKEIDGLLLALGVSSEELETSGRGFSFQKDEPLLMTFADPPADGAVEARKIVNEWPEEELARIIYEYGDERASRKIAKAIVTARRERQITTTSELVKIIENVVPRRGRPHGRSLHPATKTFQALRVAVNDELEALQSGLNAGWRRLKPGGTIAVITFQGLEGKVFKNFAQELKAKEKVTLKKLAPTRSEILQNPRSRSAHLRTIKKLS